MPDFSPEVQRLSETLARDLVDDMLGIVPQRDEALNLGRKIGGDVASAFEQAALPAIYSRKSSAELLEKEEPSDSEPPFFSSEKYNEFIQGMEPSISYSTGIPLVSDITIRPRRVARAAFPEETFLGLKQNSIDAIAKGIEEGAAPRIEKRIKNLVILGGILGFIGGCGFALGFRKLYNT